MISVSGCVIQDEARELGRIWVAGGRFWLSEAAAREARAGATGRAGGEDLDVSLIGWALPGLLDAHCHVGLVGLRAATTAEARDQLARNRAAGVLAVRDAGSLIDATPLTGDPSMPRIIRAGRHIARFKRYLPGLAREEEPGSLPQAVREEARGAGGWVKLVGDWIDRSAGAASELEPLWDAATLAAAIGAAHQAGAKVTMHAFGPQAAADAIRAGIDCLEHGTGMEPEIIELAAARGVPVTPTVLQIGTFPQIVAQAGSKYPRYGAQMSGLFAAAPARWRAFAEAGVPLLMGTDSGSVDRHGQLPAEILAAIGAGLNPLTAIGAASWAGRALLGLPGIEEGARADLVLYPADPRTSPEVLAHPAAVICGGQLIAA